MFLFLGKQNSTEILAEGLCIYFFGCHEEAWGAGGNELFCCV